MAATVILHDAAVAPMRRVLGGVTAGEAPSPSKVAVEVASSVDTGYQEGHSKGLQDGLRQGLSEALREAEPRIEALVAERVALHRAALSEEHAAQVAKLHAAHEKQLTVLRSLVEAWEQATPVRLAALEKGAVALAYVALERLCGSEVAENRVQVLTGLVSQGWSHLAPEGGGIVRLAPQDAAMLEADAAFVAWLATCPRLALEADPSLAPGACSLEGKHGTWDMDLATQMAQIKAVWVQQVC